MVVGGGPAGLFAAIRFMELATAASTSKMPTAERPRAVVLERNARCGAKFLLTGSGQCNITHSGPIADFLPRYGGGETRSKARNATRSPTRGPAIGPAGRWLRHALYDFDNTALLAWFENRGAKFETEPNGKIFPADRRAATLLRILEAEAAKLGVEIVTGGRVSGMGVPRADGPPSGVFDLTTAAGRTFEARCVLVAAGGSSYPKTGSSGDGIALATALGVPVVPPRPALVPIYIDDFPLADLSGLSFARARLSVRRDASGPVAASAQGELLITHRGFSGPLVLDASRRIFPGDRIEIGFSSLSPEQFKAEFDELLARYPTRLARTLLSEMDLPRSLAEKLCDEVGIDRDRTAANIDRITRDRLRALACAHPFDVSAVGDFEIAMVTSGGVDLGAVDPRTMESRALPGLFFAGETLDIDGDTGGYNLQAAFSTGALAAKGIFTRLGPSTS